MVAITYTVSITNPITEFLKGGSLQNNVLQDKVSINVQAFKDNTVS